jgi:hypothetical protein
VCRRFVRHIDAGSTRTGQAGARIDLLRRVALRPFSLALLTFVRWAHELNFRETRNEPARELTPLTTMRCRVDDHRRPGLGNRGGHVDERAIHDVTLGVAVRRRRSDDLADRIELQDDHRPAAGL